MAAAFKFMTNTDGLLTGIILKPLVRRDVEWQKNKLLKLTVEK